MAKETLEIEIFRARLNSCRTLAIHCWKKKHTNKQRIISSDSLFRPRCKLQDKDFSILSKTFLECFGRYVGHS